jgi:hypothetical protein
MTAIPIGVGFNPLYATRHVLYGWGYDPHAGHQKGLYQYQNIPDSWAFVVNAPAQLMTSDSDLFGLYATLESQVQVFQGAEAGWLGITKDFSGSSFTALATGTSGNRLFAIKVGSGGTVWEYMGVPNIWNQIGAGMVAIASNGSLLFGLDGQGLVNVFHPEDDSWQSIGGTATSLFVAADALFATTSDGSLMRWTGNGIKWESVGQGWSKFAACGLSLFAISSDRTMLGRFDGTANAWTELDHGGPYLSIAATAQSVFVSTEAETSQYIIFPDMDSTAEREPGRVTFTEAETGQYITFPDMDSDAEHELKRVAASLQEEQVAKWVWNFATSDKLFAGYDGKVIMTLHWPSGEKQTVVLPETHFVRAGHNIMTIDVEKTKSQRLAGIELSTESHLFAIWGDEWHLAHVMAYDPSTYLRYYFDINLKIPSSSDESRYFGAVDIKKVDTPDEGFVNVYPTVRSFL